MNKKLGLLFISLLVCSHANTAGFFRGLAKFTGVVSCGALVSGGTGYCLKEKYPAEQTLADSGKAKSIQREWKKVTGQKADAIIVDTTNGKPNTFSEYDLATNILTVGPATPGIVIQEALEFEKYNLPARQKRDAVTFGITGGTAMIVAYPWLRKGKVAIVTPTFFALAGLMGSNYFLQKKHQQALIKASIGRNAIDMSTTVASYQELAKKPNISSIVCLNESPDAGESARVLHIKLLEAIKEEKDRADRADREKKSGWFW